MENEILSSNTASTKPTELPQAWADFGFEVEYTTDGSPSLRCLKPNYPDAEKGESMHHSGGAADETEIIYGRVIHRCFAEIQLPHFTSVGLGLGYVELTIAREALLKQNLEFTLESFEIVPELSSLLVAWLVGSALSPDILKVYEEVLTFVIGSSGVDPQQLKTLLARKVLLGQWVLRGDLAAEFADIKPAHVLIFDAFSAKTTPELWDEVFLEHFFKLAVAEDGMVSTYACRMSLKRALEKTGFHIQVREGFKSKRNSTLGVKGIFANVISLSPAGIF